MLDGVLEPVWSCARSALFACRCGWKAMGCQPKAVMFDLTGTYLCPLKIFLGMQVWPEGDRVPAGGGGV